MSEIEIKIKQSRLMLKTISSEDLKEKLNPEMWLKVRNLLIEVKRVYEPFLGHEHPVLLFTTIKSKNYKREIYHVPNAFYALRLPRLATRTLDLAFVLMSISNNGASSPIKRFQSFKANNEKHCEACPFEIISSNLAHAPNGKYVSFCLSDGNIYTGYLLRKIEQYEELQIQFLTADLSNFLNGTTENCQPYRLNIFNLEDLINPICTIPLKIFPAIPKTAVGSSSSAYPMFLK